MSQNIKIWVYSKNNTKRVTRYPKTSRGCPRTWLKVHPPFCRFDFGEKLLVSCRRNEWLLYKPKHVTIDIGFCVYISFDSGLFGMGWIGLGYHIGDSRSWHFGKSIFKRVWQWVCVVFQSTDAFYWFHDKILCDIYYGWRLHDFNYDRGLIILLCRVTLTTQKCVQLST